MQIEEESKLSFGAQMELQQLEYLKKNGIIKDFSNFKEVEYNKKVTFDFIPSQPIKRIKIAGVIF